MVRKKLATAILAISVMQAGWVSALGLGEANLKSSLNQPLVAVINLNDLGDISADQLVIKLASPEDYKRADVERGFFLNSLKFDVQLDGRGGGVVRVMTREPVNEPYLNFVIEARWPTGRMLREYTLLLDLPVFSQGGTGAIDSATTSAVGAAIKLADQSPQTGVVDRPRRVNRASSLAPSNINPNYQPVGDGQHRVETNETLWRIASNNLPAGASIPQTVVALHRMNPDAFANGNMNLLKAGAVLRMPTAADVDAINGQDARAEVAAARNTSTAAPVERGPDLDARATEEPAPAAPTEDSRLSIATASEPKTTPTSESGNEALRDELNSAQEGLDRAQREKAELEGRVGDMERQMGTLQKILQLKEEQLTALQDQAGKTPSATSETATEPTSAAATDSTAETASATADTQAQTETEAVAETTAPVAAAPTPAPAAKPVTKPVTAPVANAPAIEKGLVDQLMENTAALIGVVVVGVAGIAALMSRRRKAAAEDKEVESLLASDDFNRDMPAAEAAIVAAALQEMAASNAVEAPVAHEAVAQDSPAKDITPQTGDPIAEADIYVAYGRYPQAIALLEGAISNEPTRSDFHVKLLEVYLETQDKAGFQAQYAQLQSLGDHEATGRVKELMSAFDGVEGWLDADDQRDDALIQDDDTEPESYAADESLLSKGSYQADSFATSFDEQDNGLTLDLEDQSALQLDASPSTQTDELVLDLSDFETDDASNEFTGFDTELSLDLPAEEASVENDFALNLSLDDELTGAEIAEAEELSLSEEADLNVGTTTISFDNGFSDDVEHTSTESFVEDSAADLPINTNITDNNSGVDELADLGELDELDQAFSELDSDTDLTDFDTDFGELLNETSAADLALSETELSIETPVEFSSELSSDNELPDTLDFLASNDSSVAIDDAELLDADLELSDSDLGNLDDNLDSNLDSGIDLSTVEFTESTAAEMLEVAPQSEPASTAAGDDFDFMGDSDEVATKLDLARAYMDMGDANGAKDILDEVLVEGNSEQKDQASELLARMG